MALQPSQPSAVPLADTSAGRKPLIIAIITIVVLVGLTLSLFFLNIQTAGQAIKIGKAGASQAGVFLTEASVEKGQAFTVPIQANIGKEKSTSFMFVMKVSS